MTCKFLYKTPAIFLLLFFTSLSSYGQDKYPSLLWEITGNGLEEPSYLYGTMHVSSKTAFYLGKPFYEAIKSVDQVALELEPELWFDEVLDGDFINRTFRSNPYLADYSYGKESWNQFEGRYTFKESPFNNTKTIFAQNPEMLNELLFRFYDMTGNFEEDTWLDMYIYQSARKLNKKTLGLETFAYATKVMQKGYQAQLEDKDFREKDYSKMQELQDQLEPAYRDGNLDLLDSISKATSSEGMLKYLLTERNVNFVNQMDSVMKNNSLFAAVGAAHLPGEDGCIEMLRERGFTLKPVLQGDRDLKSKKSLDKMTLKRELKKYVSDDGQISFQTPYKGYTITFQNNSTSIMSMDIVNGLTFMVDRFLTNEFFEKKSTTEIRENIESLLYEIIPGEIISQKNVSHNSFPALEIMNKTRRGFIHKSKIIFLPGEIVIARLSASGNKVKNGEGNYFFNSLEIKQKEDGDWRERKISDGTLQYMAPGKELGYHSKDNKNYGEYFSEYLTSDQSVFRVYRIMMQDPGFLEEEAYINSICAMGFKKDLELKEISSEEVMHDSRPALRNEYESLNNKKVFAQFQNIGNSAYSFIAFCESKDEALKFFNSAKYANPIYEESHNYLDSACYITSKLPWENDQNELSNQLLRNPYQSRGEDYDELVEKYYKYRNLGTPSSNEEVNMSYERFGIYQYGYKKDEEWYKARKESLTNYDDFFVVYENKVLTDTMETYELVVGDTATTKRYWNLDILKNHSLLTIQAVYDSLLGPSDFLNNFFENIDFIEDTLSTYDFFEDKDKLLLSDIQSEDSTRYDRGEKNLELVWEYTPNQIHQFFKKLVEKPSSLADEDQIEIYEEGLKQTRYSNKTDDNVNKLKTDYFENSENSEDQISILSNLAQISTEKSIKAFKEIIVKEPPLASSYELFSMFNGLEDSLILAKNLFPDILVLLEYDDYLHPMKNLLADLADSGFVSPSQYKSKLSYFLRKAKVEFRKLTSAKEEEEDDYGNNYFTLHKYWSILYPMRNEAEVKKYFEDCANTENLEFIEEYLYFLHSKEEKVAEDLIIKVLENKEKVHNKYALLDELERIDLMNLADSLDLTQSYVESKLNDNWFHRYSEKEVDSLEFVSKQEIQIRKRNYETYCYKFLRDEKWKAAVIMIEKNGKSLVDMDVIKKSKTIKKDDEADAEYFQDIIDGLISKNRNNVYGEAKEYSNYDYDDYDYGY